MLYIIIYILSKRGEMMSKILFVPLLFTLLLFSVFNVYSIKQDDLDPGPTGGPVRCTTTDYPLLGGGFISVTTCTAGGKSEIVNYEIIEQSPPTVNSFIFGIIILLLAVLFIAWIEKTSWPFKIK